VRQHGDLVNPATGNEPGDSFVSFDPPGTEASQVGNTGLRIAGAEPDTAFAARLGSPEPPSFVIYLVPDSHRVREDVLAVCADVRGFLQLPMLIANASSAQARKLSEIPDVRVVEVGPVLGTLVPLLRGLDVMAAIETLSAAGADAPYIVGGTKSGVGGYPTLVDVDGRRVFGADTIRHFNTRPARMPVLNLSLEPPRTSTGQWPWSDVDPVNLATNLLGSRQLYVFASGNQDDRQPGREMTSAWAEAHWVLSVGATADSEGTRLADYSNTGLPQLAGSGPDVVAWGQSLVNSAKSGTSYAAAKVSRAVALCASAIEQLRHEAQVAREEVVDGIPLVGLGVVDTDYRGIDSEAPRAPIPALPEVAVDVEGFRTALAACVDTGIRVDISPAPERLRRMIIAAARAMPKYQPYEVGGGFISSDVVIDWLAAWTAKHVAWFFAETAPSSAPLYDFPDSPVFTSREELRELDRAVISAAPIWRWDYRTAEFSMRKDAVLPDSAAS
jgi:hypothetical protein